MTQVWSLPGPRRYVAEVALCVEQGRHVVAVLPTWLTESTGQIEQLADSIARQCRDAVVVDVSRDAPLVAVLGDAIHDGFDAGPTTVPELLRWGQRRASTFVIIGSEPVPSRRPEVKEFLDRLVTESRASGGVGSATIVLLGAASDLPDVLTVSGGDVTVATRWFWNRVTRWDTLAHLAGSEGVDGAEGLAGEIRVETIAEVTRWNLALAQQLAREWDGTLGALVSCLAGAVVPATIPTPAGAGMRVGSRPPPAVLSAWDKGDVEGWRGRVSVAPTLSGGSIDAVSRLVWSAQARVLLPFVDERRASLEAKIRETLGGKRFDLALKQYAPNPGGGDWVQASVPELAVLRAIIGARVGRGDNRLFQTASVLRDARNLLAHLTPLDEQEIVDLEKQCLWLG